MAVDELDDSLQASDIPRRERRLLVGLDDIKAITLECKKCLRRTTTDPEHIGDIPSRCTSCDAIWLSDATGRLMTTDEGDSAFVKLLTVIPAARAVKNSDLRVLLEFDEPNAS